MTATLTCATGTLSPYTPSAAQPWNRRRAAHLFKRLQFGASFQEIEDALAQNPLDIVDAIIDEALNTPLPTEPDWADWALSDYPPDQVSEYATQQVYETVSEWLTGMYVGNFRERLALFWHNHFVTRIDDYNCPSYMYQYLTLLRQYGMGNFRTFTYEMGKTPAMLLFLNGVQNTRFEPNENYARELYELFTLGENNNYTQTDIEETARALTGWNGFTEPCAPIDFRPNLHDPGIKTIFGQTGNWNYDDVHNILFTHRQDEIATFICRKIYTHFVSHEPDETIIAGMATTFKNNNFEIAPVLRQLFKSEHFFDEAVLNVHIKSPVEMAIGYLKEAEFPITDFYDADLGYNQLFINIYFLTAQLGQQLLNPPNVAGWEGDTIWVNNATLTARWNLSDLFLGATVSQNNPSNGTPLALTLVNLARNISDIPNDPAFVTELIVDLFIPQGLQTPQDYEKATDAFKWEVPENYFEDGSWNLYWEDNIIAGQMYSLLRYITRFPEYQLS